MTTIKNKCPDNNHDNVCELYLGTDGVWYPAGEGTTGYIVNITSINGTEIPSLVTAEDAC